MHTAYCTIDQEIYSTYQFSTLPLHELSAKRDHLICTECERRAFFRQRSRNGRAAHFGARPHQPGCSQTAYDSAQNNQNLAGGGSLGSGASRVVVDLDYGMHPSNSQNFPPNFGDAEYDGYTSRRSTGDFQNMVSRRRLGPLLRELTTAGNIAAAQQIEIPGMGNFTAANFFVNFNASRTVQEGAWHGFWGMVSSAKLDEQTGTLWLNTGGWEDPSVCIDREFVSAICSRFGIDDAEDLAGANILIMGMLRTAGNYKRCIKLADSSFITIDLA